MEDRQTDTDRRHDLARVERLVQEGRSQAEIQSELGDRSEGLSGVWDALRRLVGARDQEGRVGSRCPAQANVTRALV